MKFIILIIFYYCGSFKNIMKIFREKLIIEYFVVHNGVHDQTDN